jgi:hypothetical protein
MEKISGFFSEINRFLSNHSLITDLVSKFTITFGVVLIIGGLYLMIVNPGSSAQNNQGVESAVAAIGWLPGVPIYLGDLSNIGAITIGSISWIIGIDLLLVGLGLWVRHKLARLAAISIFVLAAFFEFIQFVLLGALGSPISLVTFTVNAVFAYFLFSKFDYPVEPIKT